MTTPPPPPPPGAPGTPPPPPPEPERGSQPNEYPAGPPTAPVPPPPTPAYGMPTATPPSFPAGKQPRPKAMIGGLLLLLAVALVVLGCFLPWVSAGGDSVNGLDNYYCDADFNCFPSETSVDDSALESELGGDITQLEGPAVLALIGSAVLLAFAIVFLTAGRVLAVAIISLILAGLGALVSLLFLFIAFQTADTIDDGGIGIGAILQLIGAALSVAASIVVLVQRRRPEFG